MPETKADKTIFTLAEVARSIQKTIADRYKSLYWIKAEMNKLNHYSHSGHCYPELLEKKDGKVIAEMRSTLWKGDYQRINDRFLAIIKEPLKNGISILLQASISYDAVHGLSLHIVDIDPSYSLGELEREKQLSIETLKAQGIFHHNKQLAFPLLPKRIAIISVETSKGLADFLKIIDGNPYQYKFEHQLFPALLQGDKSVSSIIHQLQHIATIANHFDVVAIIRGGGGEVGLSSYNNLQLATAIARFPIPIITGIGHATNETVSEMVAYKNAITPSELADFLIQYFHAFARPVAHAEEVLSRMAKQLLTSQQNKLSILIKYFKSGTTSILKDNQYRTHTLLSRLQQLGKQRINQENNHFKQTEGQLSLQAKHAVWSERNNISLLAQRLKRENVHLKKHFNLSLLQHQEKLAQQLLLTSRTNRLQLSDLQNQLLLQSQQYLSASTKALATQEKHLSLLDPYHVLKRGYSITLKNGKAMTSTAGIEKGQQIRTLLAFGEIVSEVTFVEQSNNKENHE